MRFCLYMVENNRIYEEEIVKFGKHTWRNSFSSATGAGTIRFPSTAKAFTSKNVHILSNCSGVSGGWGGGAKVATLT